MKFMINVKKIGYAILFYFKLIVHRKCILLLNTPVHGNLGDQAIAYAERYFINKYLNDYYLIELNSVRCDNRFIKFTFLDILNKNLKVLYHGGGYLGDLWPSEELKIKRIMKQVKKCKQIIMPQTYFRKKDDNYDNELEADKTFYDSIDNLTVCLRDKKSYNIVCNKVIPVSRCYLCPDIVMLLNLSKNDNYDCNNQDDVLLCLRKDHEKILSDETIKRIENEIKKNGLNYRYTDTTVDYIIYENECENELNKKWNEFRNAKLVITDRIHGMVFAAINGVPCIAFGNISDKVKGAYEWISYLEFVHYIENVNELDKLGDLIKNYKIKKQNIYTNNDLIKYYIKIEKMIRN